MRLSLFGGRSVVEAGGTIKRESKVLVLLLAWLVANFLPHLIVYLATGKTYFQLSTPWMIIAESSIMLLNLLLPIIALRYIFKETGGVFQSLGWKWNGWRTVWIGLLGFLIFLILTIATQQWIGNPLSTPGRQLSSPLELAMLLALLLVLTAFAEETMFRGWIQTTLTQEYSALMGILVTVLLFGLRHLPMDLYAGLSQQSPPSAWISRILQLYLGALVFSLVRHWAKSTWASWIMHEGFLVLIVLLGIASIYL